MSPEDMAEKIVENMYPDDPFDLQYEIARAITEAIREERDACIQVTERCSKNWGAGEQKAIGRERLLLGAKKEAAWEIENLLRQRGKRNI